MGNTCTRNPQAHGGLFNGMMMPNGNGQHQAPLKPKPAYAPPAATPIGTGSFGVLLFLLQAALFREFSEATFDDSRASEVDQSSVYNFYVGVALMMFVGFGYLMTFLKAYGLGAVGLTMIITCLGVEYAMVVESYMGKGNLTLDFYSLLNGNFAVAAVLISYGGLIGKVSPTQLVVLTVVELTCYSFNKVYMLQQYHKQPFIQDCGGTIIIHVFGAYFGLCACSVLGPSRNDDLNKATYHSDIFSFVGTVFLWLFWPSFVAGALPGGLGQTRALINTVLALLASTCVTFNLTAIIDGSGKIGTVPIQNATLAGGVSIGAVANVVTPFGALIIGGLAGLLSTWGFVRTPMFREVDTCGISNLHGMPGLFGGLASVVTPLFIKDSGINPGNQFTGLVLTLIVAISTGVATGFVMKLTGNSADDFNDRRFWDCAESVSSIQTGPGPAPPAPPAQLAPPDPGSTWTM